MTTSINLLPVTRRRWQLLRSRCLPWSVGLIIAAGFVAYDFAGTRDSYLAELQLLQSQRQKYDEVVLHKRQIVALQRELTRLTQLDINDLERASATRTLTLVGIVSRSAQVCQGRLWIEQLRLTEHKSQQSHTAAKLTEPTCRLSLRGKALDNLAVATFVAALRDADVFARVELKSAGRLRIDDSIREYFVECLN